MRFSRAPLHIKLESISDDGYVQIRAPDGNVFTLKVGDTICVAEKSIELLIKASRPEEILEALDDPNYKLMLHCLESLGYVPCEEN